MPQEIALNLFTLQAPLSAETLSNIRLTAESRGAEFDVRHMTFRYSEKFPYAPGQSVGVLAEGTDPATGKPHKLRLYSVASDSPGDDGDQQTLSLCVVRHFRRDTPGQVQTPGVASNYLCDLEPGHKVNLTGPVGRNFVLPPDAVGRDLVLVATGTGIAPYRGMLKQLFANGYKGQVWLFFGVKYGDTGFYNEEFESYRKHKNFHYHRAVSREEINPVPDEVPTRDDRMYVQVKMALQADDLKPVLTNPRSMIFICGLKGMEAGILPVLDKMGAEAGVEGSLVKKMKSEKRLKIEVY
ncbi:MAG: ferredoxin--NADP(+) reductase [Candidatus Omnitrophota bacterium]|nr:ferredoxin--NADP(+) reductase [Candidatus Omnitrophota bacterium]